MIEFDAVGVAEGPLRRLHGISFTLQPGALHIVFGPLGAGKSALVALAHGGLRPTSGTVRAFGSTPAGRASRAALRRRIGVVERPPRFLDHLSLRDNLAAPLEATGRDAAARAEDVEALLAWTGLADRAVQRPATFSFGERARAAAARAVILDPEVIVADDPAIGLPPAEAEAVLALYADLARMGRTLLLAMGDPDQADWLADRVAGEVSVRGFRLEAGRLDPA